MAKQRFGRRVEVYLFRQIDKMSDDELRKVVAECASLTTSNCGWLEYELRNIIKGLAENKLKLRHDLDKAGW